MSSLDSPPFRTDQLDRNAERWAVRVSIALAIAAPWGTGSTLGPLGACAASVVLVLALLGAWWWAGFAAGPRSVRRAVWTTDGRWLIETARSDWLEATLAAQTRLLGRLALLAWSTPRGRRFMLVTGTADSVAFRRLAARLRLDRHGPSVPSAAAEAGG